MRQYLRAANIGWTGLLLNDVKQMNFTDSEMATFRLAAGDILLNEASGSPKEVGKPALWNGEIEDCAFQNTLLRVRPSAKADSKYLFHYFHHQASTGAFARGSRGVGINHLGREALSRWPVPLPSLDEQHRIAEILDKADALRIQFIEVTNRYEELLQAVFVDMFGGKTFDTRLLSDVVQPGTIVTYGIVQAGLEHTDGVPYIRTGDIENGEINIAKLRHTDPAIAKKFQRSTVQTGDIVISIRATVGTTAMVPRELDGANLTQGTARISPSQSASGPYLLQYLRSEAAQRWIQAQVKGATFREITLGSLRRLPVPLPSISQQEQFASAVQAIQTCRNKVAVEKMRADHLLASLQSRAFRGEL